MLKKLVKHGNSQALVLDRAILELLDIKEGAILKIRTDGKSLIISPEGVPSPLGQMYAAHDELHTAIKKVSGQQLATMEHPEKDAIAEYNQNLTQITDELRTLSEKHIELMETSANRKTFEDGLETLKRKYAGEPGRYMAEYVLLRDALIPDLKHTEEQIKALTEQLAITRNQQGKLSDETFGQFQKGNQEFSDIFKKHAATMARLQEVMQSEPYLKEVRQLEEKFKDDPTAHVEEFLQLKYRFMPEARDMDEDIKKVAQHFPRV